MRDVAALYDRLAQLVVSGRIIVRAEDLVAHRSTGRLPHAALVEQVVPIHVPVLDRLRIDGLAPGLHDAGRDNGHRDEQPARLGGDAFALRRDHLSDPRARLPVEAV